MPWTVDEIKSLISEIDDKPVLWNIFSDEYKDRVKKREPGERWLLHNVTCFSTIVFVLAWSLNERNY